MSIFGATIISWMVATSVACTFNDRVEMKKTRLYFTLDQSGNIYDYNGKVVSEKGLVKLAHSYMPDLDGYGRIGLIVIEPDKTTLASIDSTVSRISGLPRDRPLRINIYSGAWFRKNRD